jgi:outer membrane receptor for ferrienterochelin and colicins
LIYGSAFRAPEAFENWPDFPFYENNLALRPEVIRSVEGVAEQNLGKNFTASASVYRNWISGLISLETDPANGLAQYRNSAGEGASGFGLELNGKFAGGLQGSASYTYASARDEATNLALTNSPRHLGKLNFIAPVWQQSLFASLNAQYTSPRLTLAGHSVGGFSVFNATLLGHAWGKHLDVSASLYKLLNKKYYDPAPQEDVQDQLQQNGRNFRVKVTGRF